MYEMYNELFFGEVLEKTGIKMAFKEFRSTGIYERYMLNVAQFSAAKNEAETRLMQDQVFDGGRMKSFDQFSKDVDNLDIVHIENEVHLRVEYETCRRNVVQGAVFSKYQEDADLYPYWVWRGRMDMRERPEHVEMEGQVFRIGDKASDQCFPPADWNCRCRGENVDDLYLQENGKFVNSPEQAAVLRDKHVAENFRYNAAIQGPMPNNHSYFEVNPNANANDHKTFGLEDLGGDVHLHTFAGRGLQYTMALIHEWRRTFHVDARHNIVFQNKDTYTNVRLSDTVISIISKHPRGLDQLPKTIAEPTEIWSAWENIKDQRVTLRNYILAGKVCYIVQTRDGLIANAFAVSRKQANKFRKGVILN